MKGLFLRIDPEIDRRLTEVCRLQGLKKGALVTRLILEFVESQRPPQESSKDPIREAEDFGIDMSMVRENLQKTATERIRDAEQALAFVEELQRAKRAAGRPKDLAHIKELEGIRAEKAKKG